MADQLCVYAPGDSIVAYVHAPWYPNCLLGTDWRYATPADRTAIASAVGGVAGSSPSPQLSQSDINELASAVLALWAAVWVTRFLRGLIPRGIS